MKKKIRFKIAAVVCIVLCLATVVLAEPGTEGDPLVSVSYIENQVIPRLEKYIESRILDIRGGNSGVVASVFEVVEVNAGQEIICGAGTELILRMGKASVIATQKGGIADTTSGYDLASGAIMPANHLLVVPVGDGRGIRAQEKVIVMIKGTYSIR